MIKLVNISKQYGGKIILDNLNIKVQKGLIYHLKGSNGSGKSTLLNILYNITIPTSGEYYFNNRLIKADNQCIKNNIGKFHSNAQYLINYLTVAEYIDFYINYKFSNQREGTSKKAILIEILNELNFNETLSTKINKLSTGTKMKVSIACVLINNFDLILLDEPFANLDQETSKSLLDIICDIRKANETSFIISSHSDLLFEHHFNYKLILEDSKIQLLKF